MANLCRRPSRLATVSCCPAGVEAQLRLATRSVTFPQYNFALMTNGVAQEYHLFKDSEILAKIQE